MTANTITAVGLLEQSVCINKERGDIYNGGAAPERSFERIAQIVNTKAGLSLKPSHIALMLAELKYVRYTSALAGTGVVHQDSLVDYVNYSALWAELAAAEAMIEPAIHGPTVSPEYVSADSDTTLYEAA